MKIMVNFRKAVLAMLKDKRFLIIIAIPIIVSIIYGVSLYSYASNWSNTIAEESRLSLKFYYDKLANLGFIDSYSGKTNEYGRVVMLREQNDDYNDKDALNYLVDKEIAGKSIKAYESNKISLVFNSNEGLANIADESEIIFNVFGIKVADLRSTIMSINWQNAKDYYDKAKASNDNYYGIEKPEIPPIINEYGTIYLSIEYKDYPKPNYYLTVHFIQN